MLFTRAPENNAASVSSAIWHGKVPAKIAISPGPYQGHSNRRVGSGPASVRIGVTVPGPTAEHEALSNPIKTEINEKGFDKDIPKLQVKNHSHTKRFSDVIIILILIT